MRFLRSVRSDGNEKERDRKRKRQYRASQTPDEREAERLSNLQHKRKKRITTISNQAELADDEDDSSSHVDEARRARERKRISRCSQSTPQYLNSLEKKAKVYTYLTSSAKAAVRQKNTIRAKNHRATTSTSEQSEERQIRRTIQFESFDGAAVEAPVGAVQVPDRGLSVPFRSSQQRMTTRTASVAPLVQPASTQHGHLGAVARQERRARRNRRSVTEMSMVHRHCFERMDRQCTECNAKLWIQERKSGSSIRSPKFQICCSNDKVELPIIKNDPILLELAKSAHFKTHIRSYNNSFAFTSSGANFDRSLANGRAGVYTWRVNGAFHHLTDRNLLPNGDSTAKFAQIYILDVDDQLRVRQGIFQDLQTPILTTIQQVLTNNNPYVSRMPQQAQIEAENTQNFSLVIREAHGRRYDLPTAAEVAAIIPDIHNSSGMRDITYRKRNDTGMGLADNHASLQRISQMHRSYDALHFILLHDDGSDGWSLLLNGLRNAPNKVSQMDFYAYRCMVREGDFEMLLRSGRLFQEYVVDAFCKIDEARLSFIAGNQDQIRAERYQGVMDQLRCDLPNNAADIGRHGRLIVLPSTYVGGARFMRKLYQDAMSIVRRFGKPHLFVTFTCNPKWQEISDELFETQTASDRPDLTSRVFKLELDLLMDHIRKKKVFGKVQGIVHSVEFQKRGLPHAHILIILAQEDAPRTTDDYDRFVSAEIPDPGEDSTLYETVTKCNLHGPCGSAFPHAPCMTKDKHGRMHCKKKFPKQFVEVTEASEDTYITYRRRDNNRVHSNALGTKTWDNRWVVPYNPYLSKVFNAHINVEICSSVKAVKYLYKYIYKGQDRVQMDSENVQEDINEVKMHIDGRYVSAFEALWRIFRFPLHAEKPSVEQLAVHCDGDQIIYTHDGDDNGQIRAAMENQSTTTLTAWFNSNNPLHNDYNLSGTSVKYSDFPEHFTWNKRTWKPRNRGFSIGRMYFVTPKDKDRYYLRLLLLHRMGIKSFEDMRTIDGTMYPSFQATALALSLLETNQEFDKSLTDVGEFLSTSGNQVRCFFVSMLLNCTIPDPLSLYKKHDQMLRADFEHQFPGDARNEDRALCSIFTFLQENGQRLSDFQLPEPSVVEFVSQREDSSMWNLSEQGAQAAESTARLNTSQKQIFTEVLAAANGESNSEASKLFFLDGPGGTGKSFLVKALLATLRADGKLPIVVASSGIAALSFEGGATAHATFKIPIDLHTTSTCNISHRSDIARMIRRSCLIIWDEAPMMPIKVFDAVNRTFKDLFKNSELEFGGIPILLAGDFRQILPVEKRASRARIVHITINNMPIWKSFKQLHLTENMRVTGNDNTWCQFLLRVGEGREGTNNNQQITLPDEVIQVNTIDEVVTEVYGDPINEQYFPNRTILAPKNNDVDELNYSIMQRFQAHSREYKSIDTCDTEGSCIYPEEFLNSLSFTGIPPHLLLVKIGCVIMCIRNLNKSNGLSNGTRIRMTKLMPCVIQGVIVTEGKFRNNTVLIPRIKLTPNDATLPFTLTRLQFPVKLAFAMTINKSQCQTLDKIGLYLEKFMIFSHGQLYVALSRVSSGPKGIVVLDRKVTNVVYEEIFEA